MKEGSFKFLSEKHGGGGGGAAGKGSREAHGHVPLPTGTAGEYISLITDNELRQEQRRS